MLVYFLITAILLSAGVFLRMYFNDKDDWNARILAVLAISLALICGGSVIVEVEKQKAEADVKRIEASQNGR